MSRQLARARRSGDTDIWNSQAMPERSWVCQNEGHFGGAASVFPSQSVGQTLGEASEGGALVHGVEMHVDQAIAGGMLCGRVESGIELSLGLDEEPATHAEKFRQ